MLLFWERQTVAVSAALLLGDSSHQHFHGTDVRSAAGAGRGFKGI